MTDWWEGREIPTPAAGVRFVACWLLDYDRPRLTHAVYDYDRPGGLPFTWEMVPGSECRSYGVADRRAQRLEADR